jgi:hypothetical protein
MTKEEFLGCFLGFVIKKSDQWLPEEGPEDMMLDTMQQMLYKHNEDIKRILRRQADGRDTMD